jgi:hypothetical protein
MPEDSRNLLVAVVMCRVGIFYGHSQSFLLRKQRPGRRPEELFCKIMMLKVFLA